MALTFADCQGLGSFMSLGFVESGFEMKVKTGTLNFGLPCAEANRHLLGYNWEAFHSDEPDEWPIPEGGVDAVVGCPPCSGWSVWTGGGAMSANRGPDAAAHAHTRAFMRYAGRVKPRAIVFECVQQAYTQGRDVMLQYRDMVEDISGKRYDLYHVKMNNLMVGGYSYRPRYFWCAVEKGMPFGVEAEWPEKLPTIMDIIGDLQDLPETWEKQPYRWPRNEWTQAMASRSGVVDGHIGRHNVHTERIEGVFDALGGNEEWNWGAALGAALRDCYDKNGKLPDAWSNKAEKIIANNFDIGFSQPYRWRGDKWANVLTGGALDLVIHPTRPRCITHREAARMQGLPDDWLIAPNAGYSALQSVWGKAVALNAGRWIGGWVARALTGRIGSQTGTTIGDREYMIDTDHGFSRQAVQGRYYPDAGSGVTRTYHAEKWAKPLPVEPCQPVKETEILPEFIAPAEPAKSKPKTITRPIITEPKVKPGIGNYQVGVRVRASKDGLIGTITHVQIDTGYARISMDDGSRKTRALKTLQVLDSVAA